MPIGGVSKQFMNIEEKTFSARHIRLPNYCKSK